MFISSEFNHSWQLAVAFNARDWIQSWTTTIIVIIIYFKEETKITSKETLTLSYCARYKAHMWIYFESCFYNGGFQSISPVPLHWHKIVFKKLFHLPQCFVPLGRWVEGGSRYMKSVEWKKINKLQGARVVEEAGVAASSVASISLLKRNHRCGQKWRRLRDFGSNRDSSSIHFCFFFTLIFMTSSIPLSLSLLPSQGIKPGVNPMLSISEAITLTVWLFGIP